MPGVVLAYLALLSLCVFFAGLPRVRAGAAPLLAVSSVMVFFTLAGVLGVLVPAAWVFYLLCPALAAATLVWRRRGLAARLLAPGPLLFAAAGLALLVLLAVRHPLFSQWDEFSFWGTAAKLIKQDGALYPMADIGWWWTPTQFPGLPLLGWFVQFFSARFMPWAVYWGYGMLYFACVAALLAPFGLRQWRVAVPLAAVGLLLPFVFGVYYHTTYLAPAYLSAYGDLPAGLLFGGVLAVYFGARFPVAEKAMGPQGTAPANNLPPAQGYALWPVFPPLAALALVKENVLPVALVAAGIMAADWLFFGAGRAGVMPIAAAPAPVGPAGTGKAAKPRLWPARLAGAAGLFAAPVAATLVWTRYTGAIVARNAPAGGGETNIDAMTAVVLALEHLFTPGRPTGQRERFNAVMASMWHNFSGRVTAGGQVLQERYNASMLGSALATCVVIVLLFVLAAALLRGCRLRVALAGGLALGGFAGYNVALLASYAFMNKAASAWEAPDYARYLGAYLPGWLLLGLLFLGLAAAGAGGRGLAGRAGVLALALVLAVRFGTMVRPGYSLLDYPDRLYSGQRTLQRQAQALAAHIEPGGRVFFVCQGGDGMAWMEYCLHLLPVVVEHSILGGRSLAPPLPGEEDTVDTQTLEEVRAYLDEMHCEYILIDRLDVVFTENYGALFAGTLAPDAPIPALYRQNAGGLYELVAVAPPG